MARRQKSHQRRPLKPWLEVINEVLRANEKHVYLFDTVQSKTMVPNASARGYGAQWLKETLPTFQSYCVGGAVVVPNAIARGGMTAFFWLVRPNVPMQPVVGRGEGFRWCVDQMVESGLDVSERLHRLAYPLSVGS